MPRMDGTGPMGAGPMTGRGLGLYTGYGAGRGGGLGLRRACGRGYGRCFGRGFVSDRTSSETQEELLREQKALLQARLEAIDNQLENL